MAAAAKFAEGFVGLFRASGNVFASLVVGIVPLLICLMTAINAIVTLIGQDRANRLFAKGGGKGPQYWLIRYAIMPVVGDFLLSNPLFCTPGRFLPEEQKPAYWDAAVAWMHPGTGLFPHINPSELFVWLGIAAGFEKLGLGTGELALRYALSGVVVALMRGVVTEYFTIFLMARRKRAQGGQ